MTASSVSFTDWCLIDAVRRIEVDAGTLAGVDAANKKAAAHEGSFAEKLVIRAHALPAAAGLIENFRQYKWGFKAAVGLGLVLATVAGAATVPSALQQIGASGNDASLASIYVVNFHWALLSLLGVNFLALIFWLAVMLTGQGAGQRYSLGAVVFAMRRGMARWLHPEGSGKAGFQAYGTAIQANGALPWILGGVSHLLWLGFLVSATVLVLVYLGVQHMRFGWETTILSDQVYIAVTESLAYLPGWLGFPVPGHDDIVAGRWTGSDIPPAGSAKAWAGLLVGSLVLYGAVPRILCLLLCRYMQRRAERNYRLDLTAPEFVRLRERLAPQHRFKGIVDADAAGPATYAPQDDFPPIPIPELPASGRIAWIAIEDADLTDCTWLADFTAADLDVLDLGLMDGRADRKRILQSVSERTPRLIICLVSLLTTPDRGISAYLEKLRHAGQCPLLLLLMHRDSLQDRYDSGDADSRWQDWRRLAHNVGVPNDWVMSPQSGQQIIDAVRAAEV